jgi:hypothetical protein
VNEITTHFFGDAMARDFSFGSHCYGAADEDDATLMMPRASAQLSGAGT